MDIELHTKITIQLQTTRQQQLGNFAYTVSGLCLMNGDIYRYAINVEPTTGKYKLRNIAKRIKGINRAAYSYDTRYFTSNVVEEEFVSSVMNVINYL